MGRTGELAKLIYEMTRADGIYRTEIPGFYLSRFSATDPPRHVIDRAVFCVVAQGKNRLLLQREVHTYEPGKYFVLSLDLPVVAQIVGATRKAPYLGLTMELDFGEISSLVLDGNPPSRAATRRQDRGLFVSPLDEELLDALIRLAHLLKTPAHIPALAPLVRREIFYRLLGGDQSGLLRKMTVENSHVRRVAVAISWLKRHFAEPVTVRDLARQANMSPSSLYYWFRAVTTLSPVQFQKRLRLQEARRILYVRDSDAAAVSFRVGYASPSQFNRDYKSLFGSPPRKDVEHLRSVSGGMNAAPQELPPPYETGLAPRENEREGGG